MDLLLDVDIVVDICAERAPHHEPAKLAVAKCMAAGGRVWLYAGAVQTLDQVMRAALRHSDPDSDKAQDEGELVELARQRLAAFARDKQWLAALAAECDVFASPDPLAAQLLHALARFQPGQIRLLTRNPRLLQQDPVQTISPSDVLVMEMPARALQFVDLATQQDRIRGPLEQNLHRILHHGQYILGPEVSALEQRLASDTGAQHCITVASGTEALLISLMALGIGPGDEVITTPFTFVATVEVIVLVGATPVFVDIAPDTCNIDASLIEAKITAKTKAIIPVSLYGQPADMDEINAIAARHGDIPVIEDAAQSFGATYKGRQSGNLSRFGCTSFFPSKPLGCYGDGGAIFTSDDALAQACREIRVHGQSARYVHSRIGVGGRMDGLQCAVVLAKLDRFAQDIAQRQAVARRYHALLAKDTQGSTGMAEHQDKIAALARGSAVTPLPWPKDDRTSVFAQYSILAEDRDGLQARLQSAGIPTAVHYPIPLNEQPAYRHLCCPDCTPVARRIARQIMSLPMHPELTEAEQARIVALMSQP